MKKIKKFRILIPILAFILAFVYICECYSFPRDGYTRSIETFYEEKDDSLDGIILGTSVVAYGWNPPVAFKESGLAIGNLATAVQPFGITTDLIDFGIRNQKNIKYILIDIHGLRDKTIVNSVKKNKLLRLSCFMHPSDRKQFLDASFDYSQRVYEFYGYPKDESQVFKKGIEAYFPFYTFHNRWADGLKKADYVRVSNKYKGASDYQAPFRSNNYSDKISYWDNDSVTIDEFQKGELQRIFDYIDKTGYKVLFINMPSFREEKEEADLQAIAKYIDSCGYDMLNMANTEKAKEIGIDFTNEMFDEGHVNSKASVKITTYICNYLKEKYSDSTDHRGQEGYEDWEKACDDYAEFFNAGWMKATGEDIYPYTNWVPKTTETQGAETTSNSAETTSSAENTEILEGTETTEIAQTAGSTETTKATKAAESKDTAKAA